MLDDDNKKYICDVCWRANSYKDIKSVRGRLVCGDENKECQRIGADDNHPAHFLRGR